MESGQVYPRPGYQRREASPLVPSNHRVRHGVPGTALFLKYRLLQSTLFTQHHAYSTITVDRPLPKAFTTWIAAAGKRQPGVLDPTGEDISRRSCTEDLPHALVGIMCAEEKAELDGMHSTEHAPQERRTPGYPKEVGRIPPALCHLS